MHDQGYFDGLPDVLGRTVVDVDTGVVTDHTGARHEGELVVLCPGAEYDRFQGFDLPRGATETAALWGIVGAPPIAGILLIAAGLPVYAYYARKTGPEPPREFWATEDASIEAMAPMGEDAHTGTREDRSTHS